MIEQKLWLRPLVVAITAALSYTVYKDYTKWLSVMIPGGLPGNFFGYIISNMLTLVLRKNRRSLKMVDYSTTNSLGFTEGFLKENEIPNYSGATPEVAKWTIPHRQTFPPKIQDSVKLTEEMLKDIRASSPRIILAPSKIESHLDGIFVDEITNADEVTHLHPKDGTLHVYICAFDADIVLKKGWGELHPVKAKYQPSKFESVLIFAPQSKEDLIIHKMFVEAAISANLKRKEVGRSLININED